MRKLIVLLSLILMGGMANAATSVVLTKDNTISLNDAFYGETVSAITKEAKALDSRIPSKDPIYFVISSPGGSIDAGLELIENLQSLKRPVKTVTLFAASMGFQTVQGLGDRYITKNGTLMSHKAKGGFFGEFPGQLDSRYGYYLKRVFRMDDQVVKRTKGKHTVKSYRNLIENEYWCDGQDCIDQGFADQIVVASCDKSLDGIKTVVLDQVMFMGHTIELVGEYDLCPLNTNALKYTIKVDGKMLFADGLREEKKPTQAPQMAPGVLYIPGLFGGNYSSTSTATETPNLTKEELLEIQKFTDKLILARKNREIIKGY